MKPAYFSIFLLLLISFKLSFAQAMDNFPSVSESDFIDLKISRANVYDGESLWGHINGGADLYLEYGFDKLLFQEITWKNISFRVEFYKMKDEASAYGIYSVSIFKCARRDTISKYLCLNPYQLQSALGSYYVSIANNRGTDEAAELSVQLFKSVLKKWKGTIFEIPGLFLSKALAPYHSSLKIIKGQLGFQNGFPSWSELFDGYKNYIIYLLPRDSGKNYSYTALISFETENDLEKFNKTNSLPSANIFKRLKKLSGRDLLYNESSVAEFEESGELKKLFED
jgi:hypothetical protein